MSNFLDPNTKNPEEQAAIQAEQERQAALAEKERLEQERMSQLEAESQKSGKSIQNT